VAYDRCPGEGDVRLLSTRDDRYRPGPHSRSQRASTVSVARRLTPDVCRMAAKWHSIGLPVGAVGRRSPFEKMGGDSTDESEGKPAGSPPRGQPALRPVRFGSETNRKMGRRSTLRAIVRGRLPFRISGLTAGPS